jgi:hypothetical protein
MPRAKIPPSTQDQVLSECRRRCALCYALDNDVSAKVHGQLAHIDRNPNYHEPENLACLCLEHANLYDVRSKQSKGFTPGELRRYKADLLLVLSVVHDPSHVRRIVAQEYRKLAVEFASKQLAKRRRSKRRRKGKNKR